MKRPELEQERHQARYVQLHPDEDGSSVLRGRLDPEVGALLQKALEWAGEALCREEADSEAEPGVPAGPGMLAESGMSVPAGTSRRMACDAGVVDMRHGSQGEVLDVGRRRVRCSRSASTGPTGA